ncbi:uncharacterized protein TM35_000091640 [Trypanosoma theileri]|uniref:EF-hand domain-containing protein n=1 Tax=Trypanosoma theileri TaxID=67003 RepID=A0A1X0NZI6_9TRYP|nr:uncharacterized protein TM35_000091640 [Trypanosoma theileri]ORC90114.1 hypothetical protein TM35_000091640 [Trypanosoma theileri]
MSTDLITDTNDVRSSKQLMGQLITNCSRSNGTVTCQSSSLTASQGDAMSRLVTFADVDGTTTSTFSIAADGTLPAAAAPTRISFDMIGMKGMTEEMLRELYDAFDINQRGGVERGVMRELMRAGFSHYGAPCSERDVERLFEHATPYRVRRQLKAEDADDLMAFNEFCVLFLAWLRL